MSDDNLPDDLRIPLNELQADAKYLIGRVMQDAESGPMIATAILEKLSQIESASYRAILGSNPPADDMLRQAIEDERDRALWLATSFDVHRYLMACTSGRLSGAEKAERHQNLSEAFCYVLTGVEGARGYKIQRAIHDATQELTNHLDRIGLERDDPSPDYDAIAKKFFDGFKAIAARAVLTAYDKRGQS